MATAEQIKALLRSHISGDDEQFYSVALQVAAQEARLGHANLASEIKQFIDKARAKEKTISRIGNTSLAAAQPIGELTGLVSISQPKTRLIDMILSAKISSELEQIVHEQVQKHKLHEKGLNPLRKILLVGPPGSGKTMTASALAGELHLPLLSVMLDGIITKFMGETAVKLRTIFDSIARHKGVWLFDEFDALGGNRGASNDVGEMRRILNSFLQFLEQDNSDSLILAATNHPELLDPALFRRFDSVIHYSYPTSPLARKTIETRLSMFDVSSLDWKSVLEAAKGVSYSDIVRASEVAAKRSVLEDHESISTKQLLAALNSRRSTRIRPG